MPRPCSIVVLISGNGSNLQALIDSQTPEGPARICAVLSNRADAYGLERARQAGIAAEVLDHRPFPSREAFDQALMAHIDRHQPDLVVLAGFMRILTPTFVDHYQGRLLNIHPSLLPAYKGLNTHQRVLDAGDRRHGCSVHFVSSELDGGPVAVQAEIEVAPDEALDHLVERVHAQEHLIYPLAVRWFAEGRLALSPEGAVLDGQLLPPTGHVIRN